VPLTHAPLLKQSPLVWHVSPAIDLLVHMPAVIAVTEKADQEDSHPLEQFAAAAASLQQTPLVILVPESPQRPDAHISD
jgi:hypothetical protein